MNADGLRILHVSTSGRLGGVSEVIRGELPYLTELGWRPRWVTTGGPEEANYAAYVLHNALYGVAADPFPEDRVRASVDRFLAAHTPAVTAAARDADVVVLHDPLVLTLAPAIRSVTARVVWRCHIGSDRLETIDQDAIAFLAPCLDVVDHLLFSDHRLVWPRLHGDGRVVVVPPGIDPRSWKNRELSEETRTELWSSLHAGRGTGVARLTGEEGARIAVDHFGTGGLRGPDSPFVLQVSRWDPLKGQLGVLRGFTRLARDLPDIELVLVGPHIDERHNYPVNRKVWLDLMRARDRLPVGLRDRVHLWRFGAGGRTAEDLALNVLRDRARTVVQNSRRESFGLTVTEAMWQRAVVVGSDVDGIGSQIEHTVNGLLTPYSDNGDGPWADTVHRSLTDEQGRARWSAAARRTVERRHLSRYGIRQQTAVFTDNSPADE